jgi:hypothetical protein
MADKKAEEKVICPLMATGWLSNVYAVDFEVGSEGENNTFNFKCLPKCEKERCGFWDKYRQRCGLINIS